MLFISSRPQYVNSFPLDKMAAILGDNICIFMNDKHRILIRMSLKFVPEDLIDNKSALVQVMVWRQTSDKRLLEPVLDEFTDAYMRHLGEMS